MALVAICEASALALERGSAPLLVDHAPAELNEPVEALTSAATLLVTERTRGHAGCRVHTAFCCVWHPAIDGADAATVEAARRLARYLVLDDSWLKALDCAEA